MSRNRIIMVLFGAAMLLALAAAFYAPHAPETARARMPGGSPMPSPRAPPAAAEPAQANIPPPRPFGPPDMAPNRSK